ncbi:MAG: T9SS type A sorting domain-containing protein [Bacteroidia bacterium]|nr:T9SS type A sorting domain-containing protein [Bacteroidia bacterium]
MKKIPILWILLLPAVCVQAQFAFKPLDLSDPALPSWARMMYSPNPNVFDVERAYQEYYHHHPAEQTPYTAYYNNWRRYVQPFVGEDGSIHFPGNQDFRAEAQRNARVKGDSHHPSASSWSYTGPEVNYRVRHNSGDPVSQISWHANMYCIDRSLSNPAVLYSGGENGGVYKTMDQAFHWQYISGGEDMVSVSALAVNPLDENDVLVSADGRNYRTQNGGLTWHQVGSPAFRARNVPVWQFSYNPADPWVVFAGANDSLYKSVDGGENWLGVFGGECMSVTLNPLDTAIVYALRYNSQTKVAEFQKSMDAGNTFSLKSAGWFTVPQADSGMIQSFGGRIAVTVADTSRIYVLLPGESQSTAQLQLNGQIGVYRSDDGGETWSLPHGLIGMPYNASSHPNMMTFSGGTDTYNQIYYNTTLIASQLDPDRILIGGMSMWRSDDGAVTFQPVGGYIGSVPLIHPDNQEFKVYKTSPTTEEVWISSDGGINYSTDFFQTHESRTTGIYGAAFWGFDQGWNDDIMVGGRYHNGNTGRRDGYPSGEYEQLGGGEAPTGYVNYSDERKVYFSDIGGVILPDTLHGIAGTFSMNTGPNESYVDNSSSRILFDWDYWNVAYLGKDNRIMVSTNGGSTFLNLFTFGTVAGDKIFWMEQSRANTDLMYARQLAGNSSVLWKTTDRGLTWSTVTLPQLKRELNFTLSGNNPDELWISYPNGSNGNKIYHSTDGGNSWNNITTATLDGFDIDAMCHQFGTDGGVYLATYHGPVFYRNRTMPDWDITGTDLPVISYPLRIVPFYRDGKIRLATWDLGIWETALYEPSGLVADFSAAYDAFFCQGDSIHFVPHSVAGATATYHWIFSGGSPQVSNDMFPSVAYQAAGTFDVTLIVSENGQSDTITKAAFIHATPGGTVLAEDFESGAFDPLWKLKGSGTGNSNWSIADTTGAFSQSSHCMTYNNFGYDAQGAHDAVWTAKYDFSAVNSSFLRFDIAYSLYGGPYSDTLDIRVSTDCGATFTTIYNKGGQDLATAPSYTASAFVPGAAEWRRDSVDVSQFAGSSEVIFSFENIGHYGQVLYVDNINLDHTVFTGLQARLDEPVSVFPNPFRKDVRFSAGTGKKYLLKIFDGTGKEVHSSTFTGETILQAGSLSSGYYRYRISDENGKAESGTLIKE